MKRALCLILVWLQLMPAWAADYYVCPCDSGAQSGCTAGSDATATPTNPNTPRNWFTASFYNARSPGDRILICQGGAKTNGSISGMLNSTTTSPITIGTYAASWGGAGVKPWIQLTPSTSGWEFGGGNDGADNTGPIIEGVKLDGGGEANNVARCIQTFDSLWHGFTVQDSEIAGCLIGIYPADVDTNLTGNTKVKLVRNYFHGNYGAGGIFGAMRDFLIEGNTFTANGAPGGFDHMIYLGGWGAKGVIRYNTFTGAGSTDGSGSTDCVGGNITIHGQYDDLQIIGNRIINGSFSGQTCAGIKVNPGYDEVDHAPEHFGNVVIARNTIVKVQVGIGVAAAQNPYIQSNVIVDTDTAINLPDSFLSPNDGADIGAKALSNTIYFTSPATNKQGINFPNLITPPGINVQNRNNIVYFGTGSVTKKCYDHDVLSTYADFSRDICFNAGGGTFTFSPTYSTLSAAQAAGFNANGSSSDPGFVAPPSSGNGWVPKRSSYTADGSGCPRLSFTGRVPSTCSIGAYQSVDP